MTKFWRILKKILLAGASVTAAVLFIIVLASAIKKQNSLVCHDLQVKIDYDSGLAFLHESDMKEKVNFLSGGDIRGKRISELNFRAIESEIRKNPYVKSAEVYVDQSQNVTIDIIQKRPILRVINNDGVSYYIAEDGDKVPLCDNFTAHVAIALGAVEMHKDAKRDSTVQDGLYKLILFVRKDDFLNALVDQVSVDEDGQMDIVPKIGGQLIHFGTADKMQEKFDRLKLFYKEGLEKVGWTKYKALDLRYEDEVVCEKRDDIKTNNN
jgi:cell division protein FtsQ